MPLPNLKSLLTGGASNLVDSVKNVISEFHLSPEDKLKAEQELTKLTNDHVEKMATLAQAELEAEQNNVTKRWEADMGSDSWLSKNTRPIVMLSLLGFLYLLITFDSLEIKFEVKDSYVELMQTLLITTVVAYFGSRGVEKYQMLKKK